MVCLSAALFAACGNADSSAKRLHRIFDDAWDFRLREQPLFATYVGNHDYDDRLPSVAEEDQKRRTEYWREALGRLEEIDRSGLPTAERINYDIFSRQLRDRVSDYEFKEYLIPITSETGFHTDFARLPAQVPLASASDYENYLSRLAAFPAYMDQHIELMRRGLETGYVLPKAVLEGYEATIRPHIVDDPADSVFFKPFLNFPASFSTEDQARLADEGHKAVLESIVPSYRKFLAFMTDEYIPGARPSIGASELPNGSDYYAYLIRHHTTLDLTAQQVHQTGLEEVARIQREMRQIIEQLGFAGDFGEFLEFLRTDERFFAKTPGELLKQAAWIAKQMDGKLPALFKTLPRLPYGVEPVPAHLAPNYTAGRYVPAPANSTKAGTYWVNTYALESRPLWALPALTLHEAVPGHHLQNALRQELEDLPNFRRYSGINAYGEGWGLYAERLGLEVGFYTDPYENFGRLTYEMWRACRLVVDTGLHAMGWTRRQAQEYMAANTALSRHEIRTETDRYISWPGQALAYKIGELKIRELRRRAEEALGERFDLREFHDVILLNGPVPLTVLEAQVEAWIKGAESAT